MTIASLVTGGSPLTFQGNQFGATMRTITISSKSINTAFNLSVACLVVMIVTVFQKMGITWPPRESLMSMDLLYDVIGGLITLTVVLHIVVHVVELHKQGVEKKATSAKIQKRETGNHNDDHIKTARSFIPSRAFASRL